MIKFILDEGVELPKYESTLASGFDLRAYDIITGYKGEEKVTDEKLEAMKEGWNDRGYIMLRAHERILFDTGLTVADMDSNMEMQIRDKSGISLKKGLKVANAPATIDADYRGRVGLIMLNTHNFLVKVEKGQRLAQGVMANVIRPEISSTVEATETERGEGGYGSTGVN